MRSVLLFWVAALLAGCVTLGGPKLESFDREEVLETAVRLPDEHALAMQGRSRVIVFPADTGRLPHADATGADRVLTQALEKSLETLGIQIVDRSLASHLEDEIRLVEMNGAASGQSGPVMAHFVVRPAITLADYEDKHTPPRRETDRKGKVKEIPGGWAYAAHVRIALKVYALPSLHLVKTLEGEGRAKLEQEDQGPPDIRTRMLREAVEEAMDSVADADLLNLFPISGHIVGKRGNGKQVWFQVSIGKGQGLAKGDAVEVRSEREARNGLTQKVQYDMVLVGRGKVVELVGEQEAWIELDEAGAAAAVKRGDRFQTVYRGGVLGTLDRALRRRR